MRDLFDPAPTSWGLRGDPFLWKEMKDLLNGKSWKNIQDLENDLKILFKELTGGSLDSDEFIHIPRYAHGGMSSGGVSTKFWREKGIPLILSRFDL